MPRRPLELFSFAKTGAPNFAPIGNINISGTNIDAEGVAISPTGDLFTFELDRPSGQSRLTAVNPATAAATIIGGDFTGRIRGAAFRGGGTSFGVDCGSSQLVREE
ncbi:MAG: hypothetical protein H8F28_04980 [Fibrella sp.]|nr:hypothetical protein [Armatimonadota bacterium]